MTGEVAFSEVSVVTLSVRATTPLATLRRRYRKAVRTLPPADLAIYHSSWGTDLFAHADGAAARVFWQHEPTFGTRAALDRLARAVDVFWFDRQPWLTAARASHPWVPERRMQHLPLVFSGSESRTAPLREAEPPGLLGWVGELEVTPDRADRLPPMLAALDEAGFEGQLEICGRGSLEKKLRRKLPVERVRFLPPEAWKERMPVWHGLLCLSNESRWTLPVVGAMETGTALLLPVDEYAADLPGALTYPAGDLAALAGHWKRSAGQERELARQAGMKLVKREAAAGNRTRAEEVIVAAQSLKRPAAATAGMSGLWPFAVYRRAHRLLRGQA